MSVAERHLNTSQAPDEISYAREKVREGNYAAALQAIVQAKAINPRNIFLIALEKQVARLKTGGILPRERTEIIESLESLFDRAQSDGQTRSASPPTMSMPAAGDKKDLRLKLVVDQYFKHADEWIQRGDIEAAAKEIERVLLVDPQNRIAKEYQSRVQQLLTAEPAPEALEEEFSLPPPPVAPAAQTHAPTVPAPAILEPKKSRLWLVVGISGLLLAVIAAGVYFLRPYKPQYRPGMMYVVQQAAPPEGQQITVPTTAEDVPVIKDAAPAKKSEPAAEIVPPKSGPAPGKGSEGSPEQPAGKGGAEKPADRQAGDATKAEPVTKIVREAQPIVVPPAESRETAGPAPATEAAGEPSKPFIPVEQPPKILNLVQPEFTPDQVRKGIVGDIMVKVQIDETGKPLQAKVTSSTNPDLNDAVIAAVMRSTYAPGVMSIGPVTTWMTIPLKLK